MEEIKDRIIINRKKKKNISLKVNREGFLLVNVPLNTSDHYINKIILEKKDWILEQIYKREQKKTYSKNLFTHNSSFMYMGFEYRFIIKKELNVSWNIKIYADQIIFKCSDDFEQCQIYEIMCKWLKDRCIKHVKNRFNHFYRITGLKPDRLSFRKNKTRWGSCSSKKNISISWNIIMAPESVIDYVIIHELCHLKYMDHSKKFWVEVNKYIDVYTNRSWLRKNEFWITI